MSQFVFDGGCGEVTGSMHIIEHRGRYVALDCGLFQGRRAEANAKNRSFAVDPRKIDCVILSHGHIDHSGRLPRLVREGFTGTIYATPATRDLTAILLADSAHIQEEDAEFYNKKRLKNGEPPVEPLYNMEDAAETMKQFLAVPYNMPFSPVEGVRFTFFDAGHILGSAMVLLEIQDQRGGVRVVFSGDLGRPGLPILKDPTPLPPCDHLIVESTYGNRTHENPRDMKDKLREQILLTVQRSGKVIIPSFSVGRTQNLVYYLTQLMHEGALPNIPVFIDSPLSVNATEVFRLHPECFDTEALRWVKQLGDVLGNTCCRFIRSTADSKALNDLHDPCVIISASGMCEAGRILHHLANNIEDERSTILVVGFMAEHTLGRRIVERQSEVKIFGRMYQLKARVKTLNGFSAHADAAELLGWVSPLAGQVRNVFVVHGEHEQSSVFAEKLREIGCRSVHQPTPGQEFPIA